MNILKIAAASATALFLLGACKGSGSGAASEAKGAVVARVGEGTITAQQIEAKLESQPPLIRSRFATLEAKKEFLDNMVRFELLLQEARRQGLEQDPEVKGTLEKLLVQRLIQRQAEQAEARPLTEEELNKYYQDHLSEFVQPAKVRVLQIFLASAANDSKHAAVKAEAEALYADIRKKESGPAKIAFSEQVKARSDDAVSKAASGDLGTLTHEQLSARWGKAVADAAFGLQAMHDLALVESERGMHVLKLMVREPALELTMEQVRPRIESRVLLERRTGAVDTLVASLKNKTTIQVDDAALGAVRVQTDGVGAARPSPTP
ncbi:peptidyl-prolyl cis-trans isomerase [Corallococcus sp. M34]|uniref:peptidylprolyl isomerase n=1 Tax=Citreicoccus inhibens TaxID=2849499 RepID=UPI001C21FA67|nr:peptidyl-prolyl cis-trans isomerase [Citreicoccus inhibens]MBU8896457.1 peptidyl-prolyl cis-trans isomerase [Citreicoccus inhibens]